MWKNRIVGHEEVDPLQLLANPRNWRIHPQSQQEALAGVLDEVGWVDEVIVNKQTGFVLDGHLRVALAISQEEKSVPIKYVDISEDEEILMLSIFDPIAAMAETDRAKLEEVFQDIQTDDERVMKALATIAEDKGIAPPPFLPDDIRNQPRLDQKKKLICPECGHEFLTG